MRLIVNSAALALAGVLLCVTALAAPNKSAPAKGQTPGGANPPPMVLTNGTPVWNTNLPPACPTNPPPVVSTNLPPINSTNAAVALAARAAVFYAAVAPYDTNGDGVLDTNEVAALAAGLTNGTVAIFGTNTFIVPPREVQDVAAWAAVLYSELAPYDLDKNGALDDKEQAAIAEALENDILSLPLCAPLCVGPGGKYGAVESLPSATPLAWTFAQRTNFDWKGA